MRTRKKNVKLYIYIYIYNCQYLNILMCFWIGKQRCGLNILVYCGQGMETKIQNTSIVEQLKGIGEI